MLIGGVILFLIGTGLFIPGLRAADFNAWCYKGKSTATTYVGARYDKYCVYFEGNPQAFRPHYDFEKNKNGITKLREDINKNDVKGETAFDNKDYLNRLVNESKDIRDWLIAEVMIQRWFGISFICIGLILVYIYFDSKNIKSE